jgi:diketogulonate reductase-like aldo/keto reductase
MSEREIQSITLNDGLQIPAVGFGTYALKGHEGAAAIAAAIRNGYRLIDSAFNYENEGTVGEAVRLSGLAREQLRITSKLPGRHHRYQEALTTVEESLFRAQLEHYDLYLIHWPNPAQKLYVEAWQALIEAKKRGLIRSIGVCNFLPEHLETLKKETGVLPSVNQIEIHPYFPQQEQLAANAALGIATEAWSPLARKSALLAEPVLTKLAARYGKTPGQVVLRWHLQRGAIAIPKAASEQRQRENLAIFDFALDNEAITAIASLARPNGRLANQDPARYEEF